MKTRGATALSVGLMAGWLGGCRGEQASAPATTSVPPRRSVSLALSGLRRPRPSSRNPRSQRHRARRSDGRRFQPMKICPPDRSSVTPWRLPIARPPRANPRLSWRSFFRELNHFGLNGSLVGKVNPAQRTGTRRVIELSPRLSLRRDKTASREPTPANSIDL